MLSGTNKAFMLRLVMPNIIMSVIMLNVIMLRVIMLNVIVMNVEGVTPVLPSRLFMFNKYWRILALS